jgi:anti-anti-sigma factor
MQLKHGYPLRRRRAVEPARSSVGRYPAGELVVRRERRADALILWLGGELDRATSALLERELYAAQADGPVRLILDLSGLAFIDSSALVALVQAHQRACENGHQLSFAQGPRAVEHPLEPTNSVQQCPRSTSRRTAANNEDYYFALAMACADVDHQHPQSDRPRGTPDRSPDPAAAASGAPLSRASLAPRHPASRLAPPEQLRPRPKELSRSMRCYVCALANIENPAVGICAVCSAGLCLEHIGENSRRRGPGGARTEDCLHRLGYDEKPLRITRLPIAARNTPAPAA